MIKHPKYPRGNIYLSGGMEFADNLGAGWRETSVEVLQQMGYYPLDITSLDKAYQAVHGDLYNIGGDATDHKSILRKKANIRKHFVFTDLQLIHNDSDALIVYYDESARRGAGTISECQYAYLHDIPIFIMSGWGDDLSQVPGWLLALSTKIFSSFDDLYEYLAELPHGILKRDIYGNHKSGDYYLCSLSGKPFKKSKTHFVSKVSPLYSMESVELVKETNEDMKNRYEFFMEHLEAEAGSE